MSDHAENTHHEPPPPPVQAAMPVPQPPAVYVTVPPARRGRFWSTLLVSLLVLSVIANIYLGLLVAGTMGHFRTSVVREGAQDQQIAVYDVAGMIDEAQAASFQTFVRQVRQDDKVRAVLLRINSPGGGASASDQMHQNVRELIASGRPVVISMGNMATSGGYYMSAPASRIIAEPTTVTGSIGVIAFFPIVKGTLDKLGLQMVTITSQQAAEWKDALSPFRDAEPKDIEYMQGILNKLQQRFNDVVYEGRKRYLTPDDVVQLADGRVWLGVEALDNHLVDQIGYFNDAVDAAAELANLSRPHVVQYHRRQGLLEQIATQGPGLHVDAKLIDEIQTPRVMMLWKVQ